MVSQSKSSTSSFLNCLFPSVMKQGRPTCSRGWKAPGTAWVARNHRATFTAEPRHHFLTIREQRAVQQPPPQVALNLRRSLIWEEDERTLRAQRPCWTFPGKETMWALWLFYCIITFYCMLAVNNYFSISASAECSTNRKVEEILKYFVLFMIKINKMQFSIYCSIKT